MPSDFLRHHRSTSPDRPEVLMGRPRHDRVGRRLRLDRSVAAVRRRGRVAGGRGRPAARVARRRRVRTAARSTTFGPCRRRETPLHEKGCQSATDDQKDKARSLTSLPLLTYSALGGLPQDPGRAAESRPGQERTKTWGHDVNVLLSTYGGRGDVGLLVVGLALRLRALGAEVRAHVPPDNSSEAKQQEMRTCPTGVSTELETLVIRPASAGQRSTAASEGSR